MPPTRIAELLEEAGLSKVDLASACEVGEMTIRRWARAETAPSDEQKFRVAEVLTEKLGRPISIEYIMGWDRVGASADQLALVEETTA